MLDDLLLAEMALCSQIERAKASGTRETELVGLRKAVAIVSALSQPDSAICADIEGEAYDYWARQVSGPPTAKPSGLRARAGIAGWGAVQ